MYIYIYIFIYISFQIFTHTKIHAHIHTIKEKILAVCFLRKCKCLLINIQIYNISTYLYISITY